jgi:hypothetical protein
MRSRRLIVSALVVVSLLTVASSPSARAASTADDYQRITVKKAGMNRPGFDGGSVVWFQDTPLGHAAAA